MLIFLVFLHDSESFVFDGISGFREARLSILVTAKKFGTRKKKENWCHSRNSFLFGVVVGVNRHPSVNNFSYSSRLPARPFR